MDRKCDKICQEKVVQGFRQIAISREPVELDKKQFLKEEKNIEMNAIKQATHQRSKQDFKPSNTSLNKKNVKHLDPKHTHTLNKSHQLYISKISQDSLMSIH